MRYVCGHKIPDSDSIVGAVALAYLFNQIGIKSQAVRTGEINDESRFILDKFCLDEPIFKDSFKDQDIYLVDFNNYQEGADDLVDANIVGITDHHKMGGIKTSKPLDVWIRAVGCSNTIIKEMFDFYDIKIPKNIAAAMCCAILSDTVIFKSPTCTKIDTTTCKELAKIANIKEYKKLGLEMFNVKSNIKGVAIDQLIKRDFKSFDMHGKKVGIGQLEVVDITLFDDIKEQLKDGLRQVKEDEGFDTCLLLLTDIIAMGSLILVASDSIDVVQRSWDIKVVDSEFWLDRCLSRKKQIVPYIEQNFKQ
ncbi:MAG: manganese-dependent inorganic pyrophosphatase [Campylobacteraceae bacterium 4484_166]|nr:MAG: manganese-dependent inorganic pyrophosphatase [Campylobacteraceae bacterium 4484_166]